MDAYRDNIDCLRSGLDGAAALGLLAGLAGASACAPPKKSSPSNESAGLFCLGVALGGGATLFVGGPVLGLTGAENESSPKRSIGACRVTRPAGAEGPAAAALCDADRSILFFS